MKISEMITDRYKLRIPPTVYYDLLADVQEVEEEREPTTKNDLVVDCISRAEAIKCLECDFDITGKENMKTVVNYINSAHDKIVNLPRVKQEPKTGYWITDAKTYYEELNKRGLGVDEYTPYFTDDIACSECLAKYSMLDNETQFFKYCPNCGAKMVEPQESEEI